ncbi:hypothetical protein B566_EDAN002662 [Ephemera danica]|nr:hypothetical protein B566_EDAN002662 [Ephemera danica]
MLHYVLEQMRLTLMSKGEQTGYSQHKAITAENFTGLSAAAPLDVSESPVSGYSREDLAHYAELPKALLMRSNFAYNEMNTFDTSCLTAKKQKFMKAHRRMRTVTNYFLVNLSVADLLMAIFNCIFNFVYMLNSDWQFGRSYCTINNFVANVTVAASVFTLTGISIDRYSNQKNDIQMKVIYLAIVRPLQPRMSKLSARITIVVIWVASAILGFPCLLYSTTITYKSSGQIRTACILVWPDGQPMISTLDYVYNVVLFIVTYVLPMSAMAGCYTAMGRELWGSRSIGELTQRQIDSIRSKRKLAGNLSEHVSMDLMESDGSRDD